MNTDRYINPKLLPGLTILNPGEKIVINITEELAIKTYPGNIKKKSDVSKDKPA